MPIFQSKEIYLLVEGEEPYSLNFMISMIHEVAARCQEEGLDRVLADIRKMDGNLSIIDRYDIGVAIAKVLGSRIKVAAVAPVSLINIMAETVAVNRGAVFKIFSDIEKAKGWLKITN